MNRDFDYRKITREELHIFFKDEKKKFNDFCCVNGLLIGFDICCWNENEEWMTRKRKRPELSLDTRESKRHSTFVTRANEWKNPWRTDEGTSFSSYRTPLSFTLGSMPKPNLKPRKRSFGRWTKGKKWNKYFGTYV